MDECGETNFRADMRKMINNPEYSDVVFICKDGKRVYASRLFLVARSEVLHRMLTNGMAESQCSEISLLEVSSTDLLTVMEFLYTGSLPYHFLGGWRNALTIIVTSRFFLLENLELIATKHLKRAVQLLRENWSRKPKRMAEFLNLAVEFVANLGEKVEALLHDFVCDLLQSFMEVEHLQLLSPDVFQYCLEVTSGNHAELGDRTIGEFRRFRNIILWCACQQFCPGKSSAPGVAPPEITLVLELLDKSPDQETLMTPKQSEMYSQLRGTLAASVETYLPYVNLRHLPPSCLVRIVGPMNIISSSDTIDALGFQALYPNGTLLKAKNDMKWSTCMDNELYQLWNARSGIQQKAPGNGFASYTMAIANDCNGLRLYEWDIIIDEVCDDFIEVGLHHCAQGYSRTGCSLSGQPGGWALRMDSNGIFINRKGIPKLSRSSRKGSPKLSRSSGCDTRLSPFDTVEDKNQWIYGKHYAHKNSSVKVHVETGSRWGSCSFTVDTKELGRAWNRLPKGTFYPTVSLGLGSAGAVRIRLIKVCQKA